MSDWYDDDGEDTCTPPPGYTPPAPVASAFDRIRIVSSKADYAVDFDAPPPVGFVLIIVYARGAFKAYELRAVEPYTRTSDGAASWLLHWRDQAGVEFKSGLRSNVGLVNPPARPDVGRPTPSNARNVEMLRGLLTPKPRDKALVRTLFRERHGGSPEAADKAFYRAMKFGIPAGLIGYDESNKKLWRIDTSE